MTLLIRFHPFLAETAEVGPVDTPCNCTIALYVCTAENLGWRDDGGCVPLGTARWVAVTIPWGLTLSSTLAIRSIHPTPIATFRTAGRGMN